MIAKAFKVVPLERGSRRFTLTGRERGRSSPVSHPSHLAPPSGDDHFLFLLYNCHADLPTRWPPEGDELLLGLKFFCNCPLELVFCFVRIFPRDGFPYVEFPGDLHRLPLIFRDPTFLLRDELVDRNSLGTTPNRPFVRSSESSLLVDGIHHLFLSGLCLMLFSFLALRIGDHLSFLLAESSYAGSCSSIP